MPGFGLVRGKINEGEMFDFGIPTDDEFIGSHILDNMERYGRRQPIYEFIEELNFILRYTPRDDKTQKRLDRLYILQEISNYQILNDFFADVVFYLNGGEIDFANHCGIGCIISGGNVFTIFFNLLILAFHNTYKFMEICVVLGLEGQWVTPNIIQQLSKQCWDKIIELSKNLPSDLDFKIGPFNNIERRPLREPIGNLVTLTEQLIAGNNSQLNALDILANYSDFTGHTALTDINILIRKRGQCDGVVSQLEANEPPEPDKPLSCAHLYFQIAQQSHLDDYRNNQPCINYINYLLAKKEKVAAITQLNSSCLTTIFRVNNGQSPLVTFMYAIHLFSRQINITLNHISDTNKWSFNRSDFFDVNSLRDSRIFQCATTMIFNLMEFHVTHSYINEINNNSTEYKPIGGIWVQPKFDLKKSINIDHRRVKNLPDNIRITINFLIPEHHNEAAILMSLSNAQDEEEEEEEEDMELYECRYCNSNLENIDTLHECDNCDDIENATYYCNSCETWLCQPCARINTLIPYANNIPKQCGICKETLEWSTDGDIGYCDVCDLDNNNNLEQAWICTNDDCPTGIVICNNCAGGDDRDDIDEGEQNIYCVHCNSTNVAEIQWYNIDSMAIRDLNKQLSSIGMNTIRRKKDYDDAIHSLCYRGCICNYVPTPGDTFYKCYDCKQVTCSNCS